MEEDDVIDICAACGRKCRIRVIEMTDEESDEDFEMPICNRCYRELIEGYEE
jgi:hypothetical protein